jgi:hypothetical protein
MPQFKLNLRNKPQPVTPSACGSRSGKMWQVKRVFWGRTVKGLLVRLALMLFGSQLQKVVRWKLRPRQQHMQVRSYQFANTMYLATLCRMCRQCCTQLSCLGLLVCIGYCMVSPSCAMSLGVVVAHDCKP